MINGLINEKYNNVNYDYDEKKNPTFNFRLISFSEC